MKMKQFFPVAAAASLLCASALAGVSADEAKQLGASLTKMGAIKAGNADGSIPEYTGGLTKPPASWKPGMNYLPDPFADEKPLFKIDASNMAKYEDKLSEGAKQLLKTKPGFYINVYKTHRTVAVKPAIEEATVRNASNPQCKTEDGGVTLSKACRGGLPFPIPKTGSEAMWNKAVNPVPITRSETTNWLVDSTGTPILTSALKVYGDKMNYYGTPEQRQNTDGIVNLLAVVTGPARSAGGAQGFMDFLNPKAMPRKSFSYTPGQRRIRWSPEFAYDTPHGQLGGAIVYDEIYLFSGALDRFDWKLVGKKEMYIPYNNYKALFGCDPKTEMLKKDYINPECERWELHRVWQVEATLKAGARHIYSKRMYYWDEDAYHGGLYDAWDHTGKLYRAGYNYTVQVYDPIDVSPYAPSFVIWDFSKGMYALQTNINPKGAGIKFGNPLREEDAQPEAFAFSNSVR